MAINWNDTTNPVYHLIKDDSWMRTVYWGDTLVWEERIGNYAIGTLPTGVASFACTRASKDPSVAAGALTGGEYLYHDDTLTFSATASDYWNISYNTSVTVQQIYDDSNLKLGRERTIKGVDTANLSATGQMYTVKVGLMPVKGDSVTLTYYDSTGTQQTYTATADGSSVPLIVWAGVKCWRGGAMSITGTPANTSYYKSVTYSRAVGAVAEGTTITTYPIQGITRYARLYGATGLSSYTVSYKTNQLSLKSNVTFTPTTSGYRSTSHFIGYPFTWKANVEDGYYATPKSGTIAVSTSTTTVTIKPTVALLAGWYDTGYSGSNTVWASSTWTSDTQTAVTEFTDYPTGLQSFLNVRISGTIIVNGTFAGSSTFTDIGLSVDGSTYNQIGSCVVSGEIGPSVVADTLLVYMKKDAYLNFYAKFENGTVTKDGITLINLKITKLEAYGHGQLECNIIDENYTLEILNNYSTTQQVSIAGCATFGSDSTTWQKTAITSFGDPLVEDDSLQLDSTDFISGDEAESFASSDLWIYGTDTAPVFVGA